MKKGSASRRCAELYEATPRRGMNINKNINKTINRRAISAVRDGRSAVEIFTDGTTREKRPRGQREFRATNNERERERAGD